MNRFELAESAAGLEVASNAAMSSLGLAPEGFDWVTGEVKHPMPPQKILPDGLVEHDSYKDRVEFYGGGIANDQGNFGFGHIQASINEPLEGKHLAGSGELPKPYIPRLLTVRNKIITVDTPTSHAPIGEGPVVIEEKAVSQRFRKVTSYDPKTGQVSVRSGTSYTDHLRRETDGTRWQDASELPEDVLSMRIATIVRTLKAATTIFEGIVWKDSGVKVKIERNSKG